MRSALQKAMLLVLLLSGALLAAIVGRAEAAPPMSDLQLLLLLNGSPVKIGTLISSGSSVTNATTGTPFTVTAGHVYMAECDAISYIGPGGTAVATATSANYKEKANAAPDRHYWILGGGQTAFSMISASGTSNCAFFEMR